MKRIINYLCLAAGFGLLIYACGSPEAQFTDLASTQPPDPTQETAVMKSATSTEKPTASPATQPTLAPDQYSLGDSQVRESDAMLMVYVPAGEFSMGYPGGGDTKRLPIHTVVLDGFWIDKFEISFGQYNLCVVAGHCKPSTYADFSPFNEDNRPVIGVNWFQAEAYCDWAGGQLPTEAQWEYAARGPTNLKYPWGEQEPDCMLANYGGWEGCVGSTSVVGSFPAGASWVGALDMGGNVYEWTADWDYSYSAQKVFNPSGPADGERKVMRGGSWTDFGENLLAAQRMRFVPTDYADTVGFRCVALPLLSP